MHRLTFVAGLDFLNRKARVIHGDLSVNNVMISRVWPKESAKTPSQLRAIACALPGVVNAATGVDAATDSDDSDTPPSRPDFGIDQTSVVEPLALSSHDPAEPLITSSSVNHNGTVDDIESSGMIIDCDFMRFVDDDMRMASVRNPLSAVLRKLFY